jgi:hypothetical protein
MCFELKTHSHEQMQEPGIFALVLSAYYKLTNSWRAGESRVCESSIIHGDFNFATIPSLPLLDNDTRFAVDIWEGSVALGEVVELSATFRITECSDSTGPVDVHLQYRPTREHHVSVCVSVLNKHSKGTMCRHDLWRWCKQENVKFHVWTTLMYISFIASCIHSLVYKLVSV